MKDLLTYLLKNLLNQESFEIIESEEEGRIIYSIKVDKKNIGLVIGKGGKMIKNLRNLLKVRATLDKKAVSLNVIEQTD